MKKIKDEDLLKNYIKLSGIFIAIALAVFVVTNIYHGYLYEYQNKSYLKGIFNEVDGTEVNNFLLENEDVILYISSSKIENAREFEKEFKDVIDENNFNEKIVFVNLTSYNNKLAFISSFNDDYAYYIKLESLPAFVVMEDGIIKDVFQSRLNNKLNVNDVVEFLKNYTFDEEIAHD